MKEFWKQFFLRGCIACAGGPLVLTVVWGILGATGTVATLTVTEVVRGILTVTLLAFIVAGMTAVYQAERLPLASAILIHAGALYLTYAVIYLINGWLASGAVPFLVFTACFVVGYALIWLIIYASMRAKAKKLNAGLS